MSKVTLTIVAIAVVAVAIAAYYLIFMQHILAPSVSVRGLSTGEDLYIIGYYPNIPTIVGSIVRGGSVSLKQSKGMGTYPLSPSDIDQLKTLLSSNSPFILRFGNPHAQYLVIELLDPVCPYCTIFDIYNFSQLAPLISRGDIYYIAIYFPTHAVGYYMYYEYYEYQKNEYYAEYSLTAFNYSVALWNMWSCIYGKYGESKALEAINSTYFADYLYGIIPAYLYGNQQAEFTYPISAYMELNKTYPDCSIKLTPSEALGIVNNALNLTYKIFSLTIPRSIVNNTGTPMFIILRNPFSS